MKSCFTQFYSFSVCFINNPFIHPNVIISKHAQQKKLLFGVINHLGHSCPCFLAEITDDHPSRRVDEKVSCPSTPHHFQTKRTSSQSHKLQFLPKVRLRGNAGSCTFRNKSNTANWGRILKKP